MPAQLAATAYKDHAGVAALPPMKQRQHVQVLPHLAVCSALT